MTRGSERTLCQSPSGLGEWACERRPDEALWSLPAASAIASLICAWASERLATEGGARGTG